VIPTRCTKRCCTPTTNNTYSRVKPTASTMKKPVASRPLTCAHRNRPQDRPPRQGARPRPRHRRIRRTEVAQTRTPRLRRLPHDPQITPPGILPRQPHHQRNDLPAHTTLVTTSPRIGPPPPDQLSMPAQQHRRRDQEDRPPQPRQQRRQRSQQDPTRRRVPTA
jgi:hypothetical protein